MNKQQIKISIEKPNKTKKKYIGDHFKNHLKASSLNHGS
jgi:hypothetical protein